MDAWGLDVVALFPKKAADSPGLGALLLLNLKPGEAHKTAKLPRYYLDLRQASAN